MQEASFRKYLENQGVAEKTRQMRIYALKRIERHQGVDLDQQYEKDRLAGLTSTLSYSSADARANSPNPSKLNIEPDRLQAHLAWYKSHLQSYRRYKADGSDGEVDDREVDTEETDSAVINESVGQIFALERDMQSALRANLTQLESGLTAIDGGSERKVDAGFIDILAKDQAGVTTIIELKAETARPAVIAQILSYMGCIAEETNEPVRGIIVASDYDKRVEMAARAIPNLSLKRYRFRFEFE